MELGNMSYLTNRTVKEKYVLAKNPSTPIDVLRELAKDTTFAIRQQVAFNPNTPEDTLRYLENDNFNDVRAYVARNYNTPDDLLLKMAKDPAYEVKWSVAKNIKSSGKILVTLFEHEKNLKKTNRYIIRELYANVNCPIYIKSVIETLYGEWL